MAKTGLDKFIEDTNDENIDEFAGLGGGKLSKQFVPGSTSHADSSGYGSLGSRMQQTKGGKLSAKVSKAVKASAKKKEEKPKPPKKGKR